MLSKIRTAIAAGLIAISGSASADVVYHWVCADASCNGDAGFSFTMTFTDAAVAAGSFTGADGNIVAATITSSINGGYTQSLVDLIAGDPSTNDNDRQDISVSFSADGSVVDSLFDFDDGASLLFWGPNSYTSIAEGGYRDYFISGRSHNGMGTNAPINGLLVRDDGGTVPEPTGLALVGIGLAALAAARRRRA